MPFVPGGRDRVQRWAKKGAGLAVSCCEFPHGSGECTVEMVYYCIVEINFL